MHAGIEMGEGSTNELYRLDLTSHSWSKVAGTGPLPAPRSFHAMVAVKGKLYVFGGCGTAGRLSDLHSFDCESGSWEQLPSSDAIKVLPSLHALHRWRPWPVVPPPTALV